METMLCSVERYLTTDLNLSFLFQGGVWPIAMLEILTVLPEEVCSELKSIITVTYCACTCSVSEHSLLENKVANTT